MGETQKRLRRQRLVVPTMWLAYVAALIGTVAAAVTVVALASERYAVGVVVAVVAVVLFGAAYVIYRVDNRVEGRPEAQRDVAKGRRAKYRSVYPRQK
ncbi:hypothetical protein [Gordonia sp. SL306]|uniref:hypothetical protein n=1 Tax=Gordonia sp. SL306 TaxID=2995145 RepID=UPI0022703F05|nr:hypothetical protein [Gordonia sp. SL306]WAC56165.1 hypothetical protein OVA31_02550 [Gordonia sp. SL306]